jgi:hypothetical protein
MPGKIAQTGQEAGSGLGTPSPELSQGQELIGGSEDSDYLLSGSEPRNISILEFLDHILSSEDKTRRLGYLIQQIMLAIIAFAGLVYVIMDRAPVDVKYGVAGGSALLITGGRIILNMNSRRRAAQAGRPKRKSKSSAREASASIDSE